jgi:hypothetical protein
MRMAAAPSWRCDFIMGGELGKMRFLWNGRTTSCPLMRQTRFPRKGYNGGQKLQREIDKMRRQV